MIDATTSATMMLAAPWPTPPTGDDDTTIITPTECGPAPVSASVALGP